MVVVHPSVQLWEHVIPLDGQTTSPDGLTWAAWTTACSSSWARSYSASSSVVACHTRMNWTPMGSPARVKPQGTVMAGSPMALLGFVYLASRPDPGAGNCKAAHRHPLRPVMTPCWITPEGGPPSSPRGPWVEQMARLYSERGDLSRKISGAVSQWLAASA
jgi:hypothetical protein